MGKLIDAAEMTKLTAEASQKRRVRRFGFCSELKF
jgi:hypothetical protein